LIDPTGAWILIAAGGLIGGLCLYYSVILCFRNSPEKRRSRVKRFGLYLAAALTCFFVTPAPLPAHDEQLAPAFVVVIFEDFFQTQGNSEEAFWILIISISTLLLLLFLIFKVVDRFLGSKVRNSFDGAV
tara:strand:+ start:148 stop:537 length:390 start_codon:yes stop_codon:yes gene_type:complete